MYAMHRDFSSRVSSCQRINDTTRMVVVYRPHWNSHSLTLSELIIIIHEFHRDASRDCNPGLLFQSRDFGIEKCQSRDSGIESRD